MDERGHVRHTHYHVLNAAVLHNNHHHEKHVLGSKMRVLDMTHVLMVYHVVYHGPESVHIARLEAGHSTDGDSAAVIKIAVVHR